MIKKGEQELEDARRRAHDLMQNVQNEAYALTDELRASRKTKGPTLPSVLSAPVRLPARTLKHC